MHSAPSVSYPVGRSRVGRTILWAVWAAGACCTCAWRYQNDSSGARWAMVLGAFVIGHALSRCRVDADEGGLTVVNGYRTHRLEWNQVVAVTLRPGNPWALLDLSDGTTRSAMGIQGSDGRLAQRQVRQLRALVEAHSGSEPRD